MKKIFIFVVSLYKTHWSEPTDIVSNRLYLLFPFLFLVTILGIGLVSQIYIFHSGNNSITILSYLSILFSFLSMICVTVFTLTKNTPIVTSFKEKENKEKSIVLRTRSLSKIIGFTSIGVATALLGIMLLAVAVKIHKIIKKDQTH